MKVLEVIPVTRSIYAPGTLSYFSTKNAARGDLVKINFRNKETFAVVWKTSDLAEEKAELKKIKSFKLKPISSVVKEKFLSEEWFKILEEISKNLFIPSSILLSSLIPKALLSKSLILSENQPAGRHQKSAFRGSKEERIQFFKGLIREHFARKKSLAIIVPRIDTLKNLENELGKGIENYVFSFSSELTSKKYLTAYNRTATEAHPVLILGTYQAIFFGRNDIETLIVDEEGSRLWKEREGFPFDMRKIFEIISEAKGLKLIWSDQILRVETIYKTEHGEIERKNSPFREPQGLQLVYDLPGLFAPRGLPILLHSPHIARRGNGKKKIFMPPLLEIAGSPDRMLELRLLEVKRFRPWNRKSKRRIRENFP